MMIMQNASSTATRNHHDPDYPCCDDLSSTHPPPPPPEMENEYENVEIIRSSCRSNILPVPSPYRNMDFCHPNAPNPTPCPRPTSTSACFFSSDYHKNQNTHMVCDRSAEHTCHCRTSSDCCKKEDHFWRPQFFSPQPKKSELPPLVDSCGQKKSRQSVKRAASDGHAQIKTTQYRKRKSFSERKSCLVESTASTKSRKG